MNVETIIKQKLEELGADGLVSIAYDSEDIEHITCDCEKDNICKLCDSIDRNCIPAKKNKYGALVPIKIKEEKCTKNQVK